VLGSAPVVGKLATEAVPRAGTEAEARQTARAGEVVAEEAVVAVVLPVATAATVATVATIVAASAADEEVVDGAHAVVRVKVLPRLRLRPQPQPQHPLVASHEHHADLSGPHPLIPLLRAG
jgi:hypothetical protein